MKWIIALPVVLIALGGGIWLYALSLPASVAASREVVIDAPIDRVFGLVTNVADQSRWRRDIGRISVSGDGAEWTEHTKRSGTIRFRTVNSIPDRRFEITYQSSLGFSGRWVGTFAEQGDGRASLRIDETTTTPSPFGRLLARVFAPAGSHIDLYLEDLRQAVR